MAQIHPAAPHHLPGFLPGADGSDTLLATTAVASFFAGRLGRQRVFARAAAGKMAVEKRTGGAARVFGSPHLLTVAGLSAVTYFTTTLVDFEFKVVAAEAYPRDQLAAWFGYFYASVGVFSLVLQLFGTGKLLQRAGITGALAVLPAACLTATLPVDTWDVPFQGWLDEQGIHWLQAV